MRRQLSFALESEDLHAARAIEQEMIAKVADIRSPLLLAQKPRNALKIVAKQAWVSGENGLINGQLIAAMILFQCQLQLGQIQAARITLNELKYLCRQYPFGRDALCARILEALWFLGCDDEQRGQNLVASALHMAQGMGLRIHIWAIKIFIAVFDPTREKLVDGFPSAEQSIMEFHASLHLLKKWFLVLKWQDKSVYRLILLLLDEQRPFTFNSIGFPECGTWMIVTYSRQDRVRFEIARLANGSMHDIWLRLLLSTDFPQGGASLHAAASPRVVYAPSRHRSSVLVGLQKMRSRLRSSFKHFLNVAPTHSGYFGLQNENALKLSPLPSIWRSEIKTHAAHSHKQDLTKEKKTPLTAGQTTKRNNLPKLSSTIAEKSDRIVRCLESHGPSSGSEMVTGMGLARKSLHFYLKRLVDLRKVSLSSLGRNAVYTLTPVTESTDEG